MQLACPPGWYFPGGQAEVDEPSGLATWPGGGDSHPADPASDWNSPGGQGVARAIEIIKTDILRTMKLLGCKSVRDLDASYIAIPDNWN